MLAHIVKVDVIDGGTIYRLVLIVTATLSVE